MKLKVLKHQSMGLTGRHVLRSIANEELTRLGLLVRECVQNSLDAAIDKTVGSKVVVDAIIDSAEAKSVNKIFTGLTKVLDKQYSGMIDFIAMRDSNTVGLTGPLRESELPMQGGYGNLRKLVYEFGQPQESYDGGGSWGIGKTVCFRIGCGLVLYYSRIKNGNGYQSRMAATLIENETDVKKSLLANAGLVSGRTSTGIAWWGENDDSDDSSYPITDEKEIKALLSCFNIKPYMDDETGTCVIIPYIKPEKLIANANPAGILHGDLKFFMRLLAQRWYFPRLVNKRYKHGAWLDFKINGSTVKPQEKFEYFNVMTTLYNLANDYLAGNTTVPGGFFVKKVDLRNEFSTGMNAGVVAFTKLTDKELKMMPPSNEPIAYTLLNRDDEDDDTGNMPIIAYARKAGMVINYEILSAWTRSLPKMPEGEFVLAFFQPKGDALLKDTNITLDEYIRTGENADHHEWKDHEVNGKVRRIIDKIIKHVPQKISEEIVIAPSEVKVQSEKALQKTLGKFLLPTKGFGKRAGIKEKSTGSGGADSTTHKSKNMMLSMKPGTYKAGGVVIPFNVTLKEGCNGFKLYFKAHASERELTADKWEDDSGIGTAFPAKVVMSDTKAICNYRNVAVQAIKSSRFGVEYGIEILRDKTMPVEAKLNGQVQFVCNDPTVSVRLVAEEMEQE